MRLISRRGFSSRLHLVAVMLLGIGVPLVAHAQAAEASLDTRVPSIVPLDTRWPSRTAVAMFAVRQVNATAVEATSDGWVVWTRLLSGFEAREHGPSARLRVRPLDALRWVDSVRVLLRPSSASLIGVDDASLPMFGRGQTNVRSGVRRGDGEAAVRFELVSCEGVHEGYSLTRPDLAMIADHVERAARLAMAASPTPAPPTLDRPYYPHEVSCAAQPLAENSPPRFPTSLRGASRRYDEVAVRFIVDTAGNVERGSVAVLPDASPRLRRATESLVLGWRFRPATWESAPVRQIVSTVVVFDPDAPSTRAVAERLEADGQLHPTGPARPPRVRSIARPDGEGWVRVRLGRWSRSNTFEGYQEWFRPDSVRSWAAAALDLIAANDSAPRLPPPPYPEHALALGYARGGNRYEAAYQMGWSSNTEPLKLVGKMTGCGGWVVESEDFDVRIPHDFAAAARAARKRHTTPGRAAERAYLAGELACAPRLPAISIRRQDMPGAWRHPGGPYPQSMASLNAHAEVTTSFIVDTIGTPVVASLRVMPGSDPRAVAALRASIGIFRFTPGFRAGARVPARVVRTWSFEPPPICANEDDGADCPRVYSQTH